MSHSGNPNQQPGPGYGALHEEVIGSDTGSRFRNHLSPSTSYPPPPATQQYSKQPLINVVTPPASGGNLQNRVYRPYFTYLVTLIDIAMFIFQLFNSNHVMGSMIQTQPFDFLIGPSPEMLINQGGRFVPCMKPLKDFNQPLRCPSASNTLPGGTNAFQNSLPTCSLDELCGLGGFPSGTPDQWYRFIVPIFLHGGVLHIVFNLLAQVSLGSHLERIYGPIRMFLIYFSAGIGGFLLGANLSPPTVTAVGASGAIFGLVACDLADLFLNWNYMQSPWCELLKVMLSIIVSFALGLIPVVDNFSHIGGFLAGLLACGLVMPSYRSLTRKRQYTFGFLIVFSIVCGILLGLYFYFAIDGFYHANWAASCPNCKYLNCLPVGDLCDMFSAK